MGGVETSALKNGGSVDGCPGKWGGYTCAAEGRALLSTPPQGVFGTFPKDVAAEDLECSPLWVSTRKPHPPVKLVTLATWLRKAMARGGVDTSVYKAHSIRSAVPAHLRKTKALSLGQILARGG